LSPRIDLPYSINSYAPIKPGLKSILSALLVSFFLAGCSPQVEPTAEALLPTPSPIIESSDGFIPLSFSAPDCAGAGLIDQVSALDPLTVEFQLCRADPSFLSRIAHPAFAIYSRGWFESLLTEPGLLRQPDGSGPYMLDSWNEEIHFSRFNDYWGAAPGVQDLFFQWNAQSGERIVALENAEIDAFDLPNPANFKTIQNDPQLELSIRPALDLSYLGMSASAEPLSDPMVRRAIALGIDRIKIVELAFAPGTITATHLAPCEAANACQGEAWFPYDPAAAQTLLAEAGYPDGFASSLSLLNKFRTYLPAAERVAEEIQKQLEQNLNIKLEIVEIEEADFLSRLAAGEIEGFYLHGASYALPDVFEMFSAHFNNDNLEFNGLQSTLIQNLNQARSSVEEETRVSIIPELNRAVLESIPMIPLSHGATAAAFRADVGSAAASSFRPESFATMLPEGRNALVWMQSTEPTGLYCGDESSPDSLRACGQIGETLYSFSSEFGIVPHLASSCEPDPDLTRWICSLRPEILFHSGAALDANDVVLSYQAGIDARSSYHTGNSGEFKLYSRLWGIIPENP
jgi:peptide/nickel transport system substrate-binding protein